MTYLPVSFQEGFPANTEAERHTTFYSLPSSLERTPTKMTTSQKVTFCSHGNSAFQPIASSCKIVSGIHGVCEVGVCKNCQNDKAKSFQLLGFFFASSKQGFCLVSKQARDFPGSPVVKAALHCRRHRFDPWERTKILHAVQAKQPARQQQKTQKVNHYWFAKPKCHKIETRVIHTETIE